MDNFGTNLTSGTSAGATTSPINSVPSAAAPFYAAFDATNINNHYELKKITSKTSTNILHDATSYDHTTAEEVRIVNPAVEFDAIYQPPQGYMINGKIQVTDTGSGLKVEVVTLSGTSASVTDPIYVRIGDTVRTISSALSVTVADGVNTMNLGSAELATKEVDLPVFLGYNATDGVVIGFARFWGSQYSDFNTTATNEKYLAVSNRTNAASTDYYEVIGRFAATLSAGAGYTWSVPTFTAANLIQKPTNEMRWVDFVPVISYSGGGGSNLTPTVNNARYKFIGTRCLVRCDLTMNASLSVGTGSLLVSLPITKANAAVDYYPGIWQDASDGFREFPNKFRVSSADGRNTLFAATSPDVAGSAQSLAAGDRIWPTLDYEI